MKQGPIEVEDHPPNYCGDCFGADTPEIRCCNTCDQLIQAYQLKQWSVSEILRNSTQCIHDRAKHFANIGADEGCTVSGKMSVNKVAGNFHIAHGESIVCVMAATFISSTPRWRPSSMYHTPSIRSPLAIRTPPCPPIPSIVVSPIPIVSIFDLS